MNQWFYGPATKTAHKNAHFWHSKSPSPTIALHPASKAKKCHIHHRPLPWCSLRGWTPIFSAAGTLVCRERELWNSCLFLATQLFCGLGRSLSEVSLPKSYFCHHNKFTSFVPSCLTVIPSDSLVQTAEWMKRCLIFLSALRSEAVIPLGWGSSDVLSARLWRDLRQEGTGFIQISRTQGWPCPQPPSLWSCPHDCTTPFRAQADGTAWTLLFRRPVGAPAFCPFLLEGWGRGLGMALEVMAHFLYLPQLGCWPQSSPLSSGARGGQGCGPSCGCWITFPGSLKSVDRSPKCCSQLVRLLSLV